MSDSADALRREMAQIRSDIHENVEGIVDTARNMTDWRYYVRRYPWVAVTAATAVGYLIVPRRSGRVEPRSDDSSSITGPTRRPPGVTQTLLTIAADALARHTVAYVGQNAERWLAAARDEPGAVPAEE